MSELIIKSTIPSACFHGESWYICPHCKESVEFWSFKQTSENRVYECPKCGGKVKIC